MIVSLGKTMVNPDHVVSVTRDFYEKYVIVKTVLGDAIEVEKNYGEDIRQTERRVLGILNGDAI